MNMCYPIFTAPFTVSDLIAGDIANAWEERPNKEGLKATDWECYKISAEIMLTPDLTIAYYYPTEDDEGWMQLEDGVGNLDYPIRHIELKDDKLNIFFGIQMLSLAIVPDDEYDPYRGETNYNVLRAFFTEDDGEDGDDENVETFVDEDGRTITTERYKAKEGKLEGYQ